MKTLRLIFLTALTGLIAVGCASVPAANSGGNPTEITYWEVTKDDNLLLYTSTDVIYEARFLEPCSGLVDDSKHGIAGFWFEATEQIGAVVTQDGDHCTLTSLQPVESKLAHLKN